MAGLAWGGSAGSVLEEPALRQECGECGSRRRPAAGINGSSPAPRAASSSLGKDESCRPTPASSSSLLLQLSPARRCHGEPGKDGCPPRLTLCQEFGHAALVALLAFLGLAGQLLVRRFQPLCPKQSNPTKI